MHAITAPIWIYITYKWGDWKNWRAYYPTILFYGFGDLIYNVLFYNHMLWYYKSQIIGHTFINLYYIYTVFPCTILLFIPHYPKEVFKQIFYILMWVALYSGIEWVFNIRGTFLYSNGWSIWWTMLFNIVMFSLFEVHYKKPLLAITVFTALIFLLLYIFQVPLNSIK